MSHYRETPGVDELEAGAHSELVWDIAAHLDLDQGLTDIITVARPTDHAHWELVHDIATRLDLERDLIDIIGRVTSDESVPTNAQRPLLTAEPDTGQDVMSRPRRAQFTGGYRVIFIIVAVASICALIGVILGPGAILIAMFAVMTFCLGGWVGAVWTDRLLRQVSRLHRSERRSLDHGWRAIENARRARGESTQCAACGTPFSRSDVFSNSEPDATVDRHHRFIMHPLVIVGALAVAACVITVTTTAVAFLSALFSTLLVVIVVVLLCLGGLGGATWTTAVCSGLSRQHAEERRQLNFGWRALEAARRDRHDAARCVRCQRETPEPFVPSDSLLALRRHARLWEKSIQHSEKE